MNFLKTTLTILFCVGAISVFSQSVKNKSAKFEELVYPEMPVAGISKVKVSVYPGQGIELSQADLYEKKGLGKKMQAKQDQINGIGPDWVTFQSYELAGQGQDALVEIAFGPFSQKGKKLSDHDIVCIRDDGKVDKDDIKECPAYYYEVAYDLPVVIKITDRQGNILNAAHLTDAGTATFGYDASGLTGYLKTSDLEAAFGKEGAGKTIRKDAVQDRLKEVGAFVQSNLYFQQEKVKVNISSGGGKLNYDDLNKAQELAIGALEDLQSANAADQIKEAISIWDKALSEVDMNDKKARINRRLAGFVALNKAKLYYYVNDYQNALASTDESAKYLKFSSNTAHMESVENWRYKISSANGNALSISKNAGLVQGKPMKAPQFIDLIKVKAKDAPYSIIEPVAKYDFYKNDYMAFKGESEKAVAATEAAGELDLAAALLGGGMSESGSISWEDRMQHAANMGYYITIAYSSHEDIPAGICDLEMLNTLLANNAKISSLPGQIGQLKNLKTLNLASNQLTSIPEEIGQLESLKKLNLAKNQLTSLPASIKQCKSLKTLTLKGNNIPQSEIDAIQAALPNCKIK